MLRQSIDHVEMPRTGFTFSKTQRHKWKFYTGDTTWACGRGEETTAHKLQYSQLAHPCSWMTALRSRKWGEMRGTIEKKSVGDTMMMMTNYNAY